MAAWLKPEITRRQREKILILDGAMGTAIMETALGPDDYHGHVGCHDYLTISRPGIIASIHESYLACGCDIIETNTFGAQAGELAKHGLEDMTYEINRKGAELASGIAADHSSPKQPRYVAGSLGPGSRLPSLQQVDFSSLENSYYAQALGLFDGGVDLFQVETCQDMLQIKAALRALNRVFRAKGQTRPVSVLVTLEKSRMLLGTDAATALATFIPYPLFAFGINCGTGPEDMRDAVRVLAAASPFPLAVMPNAGLPKFSEGRYRYDLEPEQFARQMSVFVSEYGASLVGGCCGTTPRHIEALVRVTERQRPMAQKETVSTGMATSLFSMQEFRVKPAPLIIGEQTNATGSRQFRSALLSDDLDAMLAVAQAQAREGAHLLDLNVAYAGRSEARDMARAAARLNSQNRLPLMLDSTDLEALEAGLEQCAGRTVINSINLEDGGARAEKILRLAVDFSAAVVCLAIDEQGMARGREEKAVVLQRLHDLAVSSGLNAANLFLDPLTFTLGSGDPALAGAGVETLAALPLLKERMPEAHTLLGVSNISYGLQPAARKIVNAVFLYHAVQHGLDAAIFHAGRILPLNRIAPAEIGLAEDLIFNRRGAGDPLLALCQHFQGRKNSIDLVKVGNSSPEERLRAAVLNGNAAGIEKDLETLASKMPALDIVNDILLKSMAEVGEWFEKGIMQLPFVLQAAEVIKAALDFLEPRLAKSAKRHRGCMVLATVKGDIHDIGKNLVDIILRSNGYHVVNIGTDQGGAEIAAAVERHNPDHVGLSALLVKSTLEMTGILRHFNEKNIRIPVICGGAAVTPDFVASVLQPVYPGRVCYCSDAFAALKVMEGSVNPSQIQVTKKTRQKRAITAVDSSTSNQPVLSPPFFGVKTMTWFLDDIVPFIEKTILIKARWRLGPGSAAEQFFNEIIQLLKDNRITRFSAVYGYFKCHRHGRRLLIDSEQGEVNIDFTMPKQISLAEYFRENDDLVSFFISSCGADISGLEKKLFSTDQYQLYMLLHGFGVQLAETLAIRMHQHILHELGLPEKQGKRFSPGYPAWPELADQKTLVQLLNAGEIGICLSENFQLIPELSVSAMVVCHPQAEYF
ncbi:MAG: homocysteine S-methyltransferase family protein [Candidatus Aminicenantes bacterium]|nr:homocysteine S-methyltransferase family protein [Candidatus Aminicenantes bacterium]